MAVNCTVSPSAIDAVAGVTLILASVRGAAQATEKMTRGGRRESADFMGTDDCLTLCEQSRSSAPVKFKGRQWLVGRGSSSLRYMRTSQWPNCRQRQRPPASVTAVRRRCIVPAEKDGNLPEMKWPDLKDTKHFDRAVERIDQAQNWLESFPAYTCPAGSQPKKGGGGL